MYIVTRLMLWWYMAFRFSKEEEQKICKEYKDTLTSCPKLGKKYKAGVNTINAVLKRNNVEIRKQGENQRKYSFNENYFDSIDTEQKAYFLGFLYADGFNNERLYQVSIGLQEEDKEILEKLSKLIKIRKPLTFIKKSREHWKNQYRLVLNSKILSKRLAEIGCFYNKSLTLKFPVGLMSSELIRHFLRGYIDGDGHFGIYKINKEEKKIYQCNFNITSTLDFCRGFEEILIAELGISSWVYKTEKKKNTSTAKLCVGGTNNVSKILDWIYTDSSIFLKRKYLRYKEIKKWQNRKKKR